MRNINLDSGPVAWQSQSNHNRMIDLQRLQGSSLAEGAVELAYFGSSAFRVTSPRGVTVMIDPWRNYPSREKDWYLKDMPMTTVDIGVSTHAHFDHDGLNRLDAHVVLDRPIGSYTFLDITITGIADKHSIDNSAGTYDFVKVYRELYDTDIKPPNNPRSWDNTLIVVETGGLRMLHWGDNRHDAPDYVWDMLGRIDIALLPVDGSQHVMSFVATETIIDRLKPKVIIPHHYYIWDIVHRGSTLMPLDAWVNARPHRKLDAPTQSYSRRSIDTLQTPDCVDFFGDQVAFDKTAWRKSID
jgi:L-ascorbate metabolism protein UlaG (beta-lactamase superfamily)